MQDALPKAQEAMPQLAAGFDGLGGSDVDYTAAKVRACLQDPLAIHLVLHSSRVPDPSSVSVKYTRYFRSGACACKHAGKELQDATMAHNHQMVALIVRRATHRHSQAWLQLPGPYLCRCWLCTMSWWPGTYLLRAAAAAHSQHSATKDSGSPRHARLRGVSCPSMLLLRLLYTCQSQHGQLLSRSLLLLLQLHTVSIQPEGAVAVLAMDGCQDSSPYQLPTPVIDLDETSLLSRSLLLQLHTVSIQPEGAIAVLAMDGYRDPLPIYVGVAEAAAILGASSGDTRRPSTVTAWQSSLKAS